LRQIVEQGNKAGKPVTLCGEMGGAPLAALALAAVGYRSLSMPPANIGPVKAMILAMDLGEARRFMLDRLESHDGAPSMRADLLAFAEAKGIPL
jgi:phosphotransferase system enzyme I (PtsP)